MLRTFDRLNFLLEDIDTSFVLRSAILISLVTTLLGILSVTYWTTNRQTQITKSKSQQKKKVEDNYVHDSQSDGAGDQEENLYFNDWTRSDYRRTLLDSIHGDEDGDDADATIEASDDEQSDDEFDDGNSDFDVKNINKLPKISSVSSLKMQKDFLTASSKLKVLSYLGDEAYLKSLRFMEYVELPHAGMDVFHDKPHDGSLYIVLEGKVDVCCGLISNATSEERNKNIMSLTAGPGDLMTSLLSALSGLIEEYNKSKGNNSIDFRKIHVKATTLEDNTRLIRIPSSSFLAMLESHPHDVYQIAQTIVSRCQRVTIYTLVKNLGMGYEILYNHGKNNSEYPNNSKHSPDLNLDEIETRKNLALIVKDIVETNGKSISTGPIDVKPKNMERIASLLSQALGSKSANAIKTIQDKSLVTSFNPGEEILAAETKTQYVYFVLDGSVTVCTNVEEESGIKTHVNATEDQCRPLYDVLPGDIVGVLSCFTDEVSFVTLRSSTKAKCPTILLQLPKENFRSLLDIHPEILMHCIQKILTIDFSPLVHLFEWGVDCVHFQAGESLATKGTICDKMQVVLSGRIQAAPKKPRSYKNSSKNEKEYGRGSCIGEALVLLGEKWPNDVHAIRNSEVAILPVNVLEYVIQMFPNTAISFAKRIASRQIQRKGLHRKTSQTLSPNSNGLSVATVAIVPLCFKSASEAHSLCEHITASLGKIESCSLMTKSLARKHVGNRVFKLRNAVHQLKITRLFGDLEESQPLTIYETESKFSWWTKLCIQQADCVILVIDGQKVPSCNNLERYLSWAYGKRLVRHVQALLLQDVKVSKEAQSEIRVPLSHEVSAWIESRQFIEAQHLVRKPLNLYENDVARMCRRISGRSLGLALGGGGARGLAHLGVIRALIERGVSVDICGGTSQGAFVGALYAKNPDSISELTESCKKMAAAMSDTKQKIFDLTLPIVSYFNGRGFNEGIIDCIGKETMINELILNFFCTSTDLCRSAQVIHTKGLCWKYVRASMSLHGYLPPIAENGQLLVDGGYSNIVPGDIMLEQMNAKAVICVDVSKEDDNDFYEYGTSLNGFWLLLNSFNPFTKTVRVPSMGDLSQKLIWVQATKRRSEVTETADLWLAPPVSNYGVLEYDKFDEIVQKGYDHAVPLIDKFIKENPWIVSSSLKD